MIPSRQLGYPQQVSVIKFVDNGPVLPPVTGDPDLIRIGAVTYYRDIDGTLYPLVPGASGAGVVKITTSTYLATKSDSLLLVDSSATAVTITVPAGVVRLRVIQLGANSVTLTGSNFNGSTDLILNAPNAVREITWVPAFGSVSAKYILTGSVG